MPISIKAIGNHFLKCLVMQHLLESNPHKDRATFVMQFSNYDKAPKSITEEIIKSKTQRLGICLQKQLI